MTFRCDVPGCGAEHWEWRADDLDKSRRALAGAEEIGWRLTKDRGVWIAVCPSCVRAKKRVKK